MQIVGWVSSDHSVHVQQLPKLLHHYRLSFQEVNWEVTACSTAWDQGQLAGRASPASLDTVYAGVLPR